MKDWKSIDISFECITNLPLPVASSVNFNLVLFLVTGELQSKSEKEKMKLNHVTLKLVNPYSILELKRESKKGKELVKDVGLPGLTAATGGLCV